MRFNCTRCMDDGGIIIGNRRLACPDCNGGRDNMDSDTYMIVYEDTERPPDIIIGHEEAEEFFQARSDNWNCSLFQKVKDNTGYDCKTNLEKENDYLRSKLEELKKENK